MVDLIRLCFPRFHNPDGTVDSMCTRCFAPIARRSLGSDLESMEDAHVCAPRRMREFQPSDRELP